MTKQQAQSAMIDLLKGQLTELTVISKIELGDDVIAELTRLQSIIDSQDGFASTLIDKFCSGPAAAGMPEMISDCEGIATIEELMQTVSRWMDFDNEAQAALFILKYADWEDD